jgi:protocatechuate 3,4-dioxygenase beta subunit
LKTQKDKSRRQFLRNTALATLSIGVLPSALKANKKVIPPVLCDKTTLDYYGEGPFYTDNPPAIGNMLADTEEPGTRLIISGRVYNLECSEFLPNTLIDIWHATDAGQYDNVGYTLRGTTTTNEQGFFLFETIKPGKYLNGGTYRPSHIHFKITPPGFDTLTTQLYFEGDSDIPGDAAASQTSGTFDATHRIIPLVENGDGKLEGVWDIVINGSGVTGSEALHLDKGIVYSVSPNPVTGKALIKYGVYRKANVSLIVYDAMGRKVATLEERQLMPQKYEAEWHPDAGLPNGHYFVALKINDLQVHYLKMILNR